MRAPRTAWLYIAREVIQYSLLGITLIAILMLSRGLYRMLDELLGAGIQLADLAVLVRLLGTSLLIHALPISFLFGLLLAIGRMAADREILALRSCGLGLGQLMAPVAAIGIALSGLILPLSLETAPAAQRELAGVVQQLLVRGASIEAGRFNRLGERTFYVDERGPDGELRGILVADRSDPQRPFTVFAESGEVLFDTERFQLTLRLDRGDIHVDNSQDVKRYQRIGFESLEYRIDMAEELGSASQPRPRELPLGELRSLVARIRSGEETGPLRRPPSAYVAELQSRYTLPLAPALFAAVGLPLGLQRDRRGARSTGVIWCTLVAFGYYALHSFASLLVVEQSFPAATLWLPNAAAASAGAWLLWRAGRAG